MKVRMGLNGADIEQYHLQSLEGNLEVLMKPAPIKSIVTNANDSINGVMVVTTPTSTKVDKREILLKFKITSNSIIDLQRELDGLQTTLINGVDYGGSPSGINELYVPLLGKTFRLKFVSFDKYSNFGLDGKAIIVIKFLEPDPTQTQL